MLKNIVIVSGLVLAIGGCFRANTSCRLRCGTAEPLCPADFRCVKHGRSAVCARSDDQTCADTSDGPLDTIADTSADASPDAVSDERETFDVPVSEPVSQSDVGDGGTDADAGTDVGTDNPHDSVHICDGGVSGYLGPSLCGGLVLLLDPSNLPPPDSEVVVWSDRSGLGNDAKEEDPDYTPLATTNGVRFVATGQGVGAGFEVASAPFLDLGTDDFLVELVVDMPRVGSQTQSTPTSFMSQRDPPLQMHQVAIDWDYANDLSENPTVTAQVNAKRIAPAMTLPPGPALLSLSRTGTDIQLRINGAPVGQDTLDASESTTNHRPIVLGSLGDLATPIEGMHVVVLVRGPVDPQEVQALEQALLRAFPN